MGFQLLYFLSLYCYSKLGPVDLEEFIFHTRNDGGINITVRDYYHIKSEYPDSIVENIIEVKKDNSIIRKTMVIPRNIILILQSMGVKIIDCFLESIKNQKIILPGMETVKVKKTRGGFSAPELPEILDYMKSQTKSTSFSQIESQKFFDYYQSKGWMVGSKKMVDWKAACRSWINSSYQKTKIIRDTPSAPEGFNNEF